MNDPSIVRAPAAVAQNIDEIVQVESKALQPRSISEALTNAIGGFVSISFVGLHMLGLRRWIVVNSGGNPPVAPFDPFPLPLLSTFTSLEAVLLTAFV